MANGRFSLRKPFGGFAARPEEIWNQVATTALDMTARARVGLSHLGDSVNTVASRVGDGQIAAQRQNAQLVQALATAAPRAGKPATRSSVKRPVQNSTGAANMVGRAREALMTVDAGVRGAADTLTFGMADEIAGGMNALFDGSDRPLLERFSEHHQDEVSRDLEDLEKRRLARRLGQAAGLALSVGVQTPATTARAAAPTFLNQMRNGRSLGFVPRLQTVPREVGAASAAGGLVNGGVQILTDFGSGRRTTPGDFAGAVVGGMVAAPATIFHSPSLAGAVEGAVTSLSQDVIGGRPISYDTAFRSGAGGAAGGHIADVIGTGGAKALGRDAKGELGEALSIVKTWARGDVPLGYGKRRYLSKGYTVVDPGSTIDSLAESKLGRWVRISNPQVLGNVEIPNSRIDWWDPSDLGKIAGFGGAIAGSHLLPPTQTQAETQVSLR